MRTLTEEIQSYRAILNEAIPVGDGTYVFRTHSGDDYIAPSKQAVDEYYAAVRAKDWERVRHFEETWPSMDLLKAKKARGEFKEGVVPNPEVEKAKSVVLQRYPDAKFVSTTGRGAFAGHYDLVVTEVLAQDVESESEGWILAAKKIEGQIADSFRAE